MLDKLRTEQTSTPSLNGLEAQRGLLEATKDMGNEVVPQAYVAEILSFKVRSTFGCLFVCSSTDIDCVIGKI